MDLKCFATLFHSLLFNNMLNFELFWHNRVRFFFQYLLNIECRQFCVLTRSLYVESCYLFGMFDTWTWSRHFFNFLSTTTWTHILYSTSNEYLIPQFEQNIKICNIFVMINALDEPNSLSEPVLFLKMHFFSISCKFSFFLKL